MITSPPKNRKEAEQGYDELFRTAAQDGQVFYSVARDLALNDLYFLMTWMLGREDMCHDWLWERCMEIQAEPDGYLDLWAREHYKAVDIDEPVPTPNGFVKHGNLRVGDYVFGRDGKPQRVIATTPVFNEAECYRVSFDDGYSVVVSGEHLWAIEYNSRARVSGTNKRLGRVEKVISTKDLAEYDHSPAVGHQQSTRFSVSLPEPVNGPKQDLPIHPYVFGVWLGDGAKNGTRVTVGFEDLEETYKNLTNAGVKISQTMHSNCASLRLGNGIRGDRFSSEITNALRELGVWENKHIPEKYLLGSYSQRLELLQGLMDTDGSCNIRGTAYFVSASYDLAYDTFILACSLGLKPALKKRQGRFKGKKHTYYQLTFQAYKSRPPFKLKRKLNRCKDGKRAINRRFITGVERIESTPVSCIQVERDPVYLIGERFVPTHNSTIITFGLSIQDILKDPEITIGIFSCTRPIAKGFLYQIKRELETNTLLQETFPDILWTDPKKESPRWSMDSGLVVKRKSNPKEATVEAHGLVDGQPTSRHFRRLVYDDVVTLESVSTPEMIAKVTNAWELSLNLGARGGSERYIGTRYHFNDTYKTLMDRGTAKKRIYPATDDGTEEGNPVLLDQETLRKKRRDMGPYTFGCQMLQNPVADSAQGFKIEWLNYWKAQQYANLNLYLLCDPASEKKKHSDYTAMAVIGLGPDKNTYVITMVRDRMNLTERARMLMYLHREFSPIATGYEKYGKDSDIEHIESVQAQQNYRFGIIPLGGTMKKEDRIRRLIPDCEQGRFYLPSQCIQRNWEGQQEDLTKVFVNDEYEPFPVGLHDDLLDCISRIKDEDLGAVYPKIKKPKRKLRRRDARVV